MQRWMRDIFKTARAAAFVVAACASLAAGAHAQQQGGAKSNPLPADPPAVAPNYKAPERGPPSVEGVGGDAGEPLSLTLDEAVRLALENNNDIEATRIEVGVAEQDLNAARGAYDLRLSSETFFEHSETPVASFLAGGDGGAVNANEMSSRVGFEGLSKRAGGSYKFEVTTRRLSSNNVFNDINPTYSTG